MFPIKRLIMHDKFLIQRHLRVVFNDQTKFQKLAILARKIGNIFQKDDKTFYRKTLHIWQVFGYLASLIMTPSDFVQTPHSGSSRESTARRRSLRTKCWRRKDFRHSPCTAEVGSPSSPANWEKLGRLLFVMMFQHRLETTPMWHLRGPRGQCRQQMS